MIFQIFIIFIFYGILIVFLRKYYFNISNPLLVFSILVPFLLLVANIESPDSFAYRNFLFTVDTNFFNIQGTEFEEGFQILTKIIKFLIGNSYSLYIFVLSLINCLFIVELIKVITQNLNYGDNRKEKQFDYVLALVMYFSYFGLYYNSIAIRANYALTIIYLITIIYINRKISLRNVLLTILMLLLASSFHITSIIGVLVLIIFYISRQYTKKIYIWTWLLCGCVYFLGLSKSFVNWFLNSEILQKLQSVINSEGLSEIIRYSTFSNIENSISFKFIFQYMVAFLLIFPKNPTTFYYRYLNVYFFGIIIGALGGSMTTITRVQDFFTFSLFILSWLFIREIKTIKDTVLYCAVMIIPQLIFFIRILNNPF